MAGLISTGLSLEAGAVSDLFKGFADKASADIRAKGLNLDAQGLRIKAQGNLAEASNYDLAGNLAEQNKQFTVASTAIKQAQLDRSITQTVGGISAAAAGSGLKTSGSALDVLRDSAEQGALTKQVAGAQGLITEAGYEEQRQSYTTMASSARYAAAGEQDIAGQTDQIANDTRHLGELQQAGDFTSSAIKGAAGIFALFGL
jgi:hypothetical protein